MVGNHPVRVGGGGCGAEAGDGGGGVVVDLEAFKEGDDRVRLEGSDFGFVVVVVAVVDI